MGGKKPVEAPKPAKPATAGKTASSGKATGAAEKKSKSLAYGKVHFKAMLYRGKWRFINKVEADKNRKKKLSKLAKLKAKGIEVKPKVSKFRHFVFYSKAIPR